MKKIYKILSLLLINVTITFSQPVITSAVNPEVGDNYSGYLVDTNAIDLSLTGVNITWDFTTLVVPSSSFSTFTGYTVSATPYATDFPSASVGVLDASTSLYTYFITSSSTMELNGFASASTGTTILTDYAKLVTFPFTYNSTVSDVFSGTQTIGIATFNVTGTSATIADAYGTLILPSGTYSNVLRAKITQNAVSTTTGGSINTSLATYYWYGDSYKYPLLEVDITTTTGTGIFASSANSYAKKAFVVTPQLIGIIEKPQKHNFNFNVFPNPSADNKATFSFNLDEFSDVSISLVNVLGQEQTMLSGKRMQQGFQKETVDLNDLSKGIYFVKININGIVSQKKLIIN